MAEVTNSTSAKAFALTGGSSMKNMPWVFRHGRDETPFLGKHGWILNGLLKKKVWWILVVYQFMLELKLSGGWRGWTTPLDGPLDGPSGVTSVGAKPSPIAGCLTSSLRGLWLSDHR